MTAEEEADAREWFIELKVAEYLDLNESWDEAGARLQSIEDWDKMTEKERHEI